MKQTHIRIFIMCLSIFILSMPIVNANSNDTAVNGQTEANMTVIGNLLPEETKSSLEEEKVTDPIKSVAQKKDDNLPKTGEQRQPLPLIGLFMLIGALLMFFQIIKNRNLKN